MKVLVNGFAARTGGPETFLLNLLAEMVLINPSVEYVLLIPENRCNLYSGLSENVILEPVQESIADSIFKRLIHEHISIPMKLFSGRFDAYFQADELLSPVIGLSRIPSLIVFHSTQHMLIPHLVGDTRLRLFYLKLIKGLAMRLATVPVTVSHHARGELSGLYPFAHEKIKVIYHGIDFNQFKPQHNSQSILQKRYGIRDYILSVSNRHAFKNYYNLIRAYNLLVQQDNIREDLVIVGGVKSLSEERRIQGHVDQNNLSKRVHILDYIGQSQIASVYQNAKAYLFPSTFETFGFTPLEAMACGVPCACSRLSCIPEICGDAAEYFDPFDIEDMARAMKYVLFDEQGRRELIGLGLRHVKQFRWGSASKEYLTLLRNLAGKNV